MLLFNGYYTSFWKKIKKPIEMFLDLSDNISMNKCLSQKMLCAARLASIFAVVVSSQNFWGYRG